MYFPNPFKFKGMQPSPLRRGPRPDLAFWAVFVASLLWIMGWKHAVLRENLRKTGLSASSGLISGWLFRWRLLYHAARDLLSLLTVSYPRRLRLRRGSEAALHAMRSGPSLFLTAHIHHFEALGSFLAAQGVPLRAVARPMSRPWAQAWLSRLRERMGLPIVWSERPRREERSAALPRRAGSALWMRRGLAHVRKGGCLALLWDQRPPGNAYVTGVFFGEKVKCDGLPGLLLRNLDLPVYVGLLGPQGEVRLARLHGKPAESREEPSKKDRLALKSSGGAGLAGLLARYHRWLEAATRRYPGYAYWLLHRRFG